MRASVARVDLIIWTHLFHKTVHIEDKILRLGFEGNLQLMRYFQFLSLGSRDERTECGTETREAFGALQVLARL